MKLIIICLVFHLSSAKPKATFQSYLNDEQLFADEPDAKLSNRLQPRKEKRINLKETNFEHLEQVLIPQDVKLKITMIRLIAKTAKAKFISFDSGKVYSNAQFQTRCRVQYELLKKISPKAPQILNINKNFKNCQKQVLRIRKAENKKAPINSKLGYLPQRLPVICRQIQTKYYLLQKQIRKIFQIWTGCICNFLSSLKDAIKNFFSMQSKKNLNVIPIRIDTIKKRQLKLNSIRNNQIQSLFGALKLRQEGIKSNEQKCTHALQLPKGVKSKQQISAPYEMIPLPRTQNSFQKINVVSKPPIVPPRPSLYADQVIQSKASLQSEYQVPNDSKQKNNQSIEQHQRKNQVQEKIPKLVIIKTQTKSVEYTNNNQKQDHPQFVVPQVGSKEHMLQMKVWEKFQEEEKQQQAKTKRQNQLVNHTKLSDVNHQQGQQKYNGFVNTIPIDPKKVRQLIISKQLSKQKMRRERQQIFQQKILNSMEISKTSKQRKRLKLKNFHRNRKGAYDVASAQVSLDSSNMITFEKSIYNPHVPTLISVH